VSKTRQQKLQQFGGVQAPTQSSARNIQQEQAHEATRDPSYASNAFIRGRDFQHVSPEQLPSDPRMYWRLSNEDQTILAHITSLCQNTIMTVPETDPDNER
jgi:hypothetical protein